MKYFLIILLFITTLGICQHEFTDEEVLNITNKIVALQKSDSLKTIQIKDLEHLVDKLEYQSNIDSLIINGKDIQINLLKEREKYYEEKLKIVKPTFWENKYLWYVYGAGTMILSSIIVENVK